MQKYRKFIVALVGFAVVLAGQYFGTNPPAWFAPAVALLSALGVYATPNERS